jgi:nitroimidazol reductase NimA-like FMN-containing flavoprotein (pyridoxamine 5'-phosphate oxidase superfamily)
MPEEQPTGRVVRDRPDLPAGYGVPKSGKGLLPWSWARERLEQAAIYWVLTGRPAGRPHAIPIWGSWLADRFYFGASAETRRGRNLATNPAVNVHIERGEAVVIVEGRAAEIVPDPALAAQLVADTAAKYQYRTDPADWQKGGLYVVRPQVVLAWSRFPRDATRWRFAAA